MKIETQNDFQLASDAALADMIWRGMLPPDDAQQRGVQRPMPQRCDDPGCTQCQNR